MSVGSARTAFALLAVLAILACNGPFDDVGQAFLTVRHEDEHLDLVHDPLLSDLTLTPPADGAVQLSFVYQDPPLELTLFVDGNEVGSGDRVELPADARVLRATLRFAGRTFVSEEPGAAGHVEVELLEMDEEAGSASLRASFEDVLLREAQGSGQAEVNGFVEAAVGSSPR